MQKAVSGGDLVRRVLWQPALVARAETGRVGPVAGWAAWTVYGTPAGSIWRAWRGHPWASNRHRVNNQPECFSKHETLSRPRPLLARQGGARSQDPSIRLTSKLRPRKNKLGAARVPEEAVVRVPLPDPTLVNVFLILCRCRRPPLQIPISLRCPLPSSCRENKKGVS